MRKRTAFQREWQRQVEGLTPYDMRRCYSHWLEQAGVPPTRIQIYMGHAPRTSDDLYRWHDVKRYLVSDAKLLEKYVGSHQKKMMVVG